MKGYLVIMASAFTLIFVAVLIAELLGMYPNKNPALLLISSGLLGAVTWVRVFLARRAAAEDDA